MQQSQGRMSKRAQSNIQECMFKNITIALTLSKSISHLQKLVAHQRHQRIGGPDKYFRQITLLYRNVCNLVLVTKVGLMVPT